MKSMEASEVDDTSAILQPIPKEEQSVSEGYHDALCLVWYVTFLILLSVSWCRVPFPSISAESSSPRFVSISAGSLDLVEAPT